MTGMASHWTEWALVSAVLALFMLPLMLICTGYFRAVKADERDIRDHGIATQGRVVEIRRLDGEGGGRTRLWIVTVEFTVPERTEPVHFQMMRPGSTSEPPKEWRNLNEGQLVPIHYRQKWPSLAVIDELVR